LSFGVFTSMQISAEFFAFAVSTIFMGWFGERALAGQQIVLQISSLLLVIPYVLSQSSGVLISQAVGRGRVRDVQSIGQMALFLGGIIGVILGVFYLLFPKVIIAFYLDIHDIAMQPTVKLATILLAIAAVSQLFDILRAIASGALRGLFDTKVPMFVSVFISCLTSLPVGYILAYSFHLGAVGIRLGFVVSFFVGAVILVHRFQCLSHEGLLEARILKKK
jgi:multidrug resistance protein, MATE family